MYIAPLYNNLQNYAVYKQWDKLLYNIPTGVRNINILLGLPIFLGWLTLVFKNIVLYCIARFGSKSIYIILYLK